MKIQESAENYLETILILSRRNPYVRSIDIANELAFSKPSVSVAMKNLRENGYILMDDQGHITLSSMGKEIAETMYERHTMLSQWLMYLGVERQPQRMHAALSMWSAPRASVQSRTISPEDMSFRKTNRKTYIHIYAKTQPFPAMPPGSAVFFVLFPHCFMVPADGSC